MSPSATVPIRNGVLDLKLSPAEARAQQERHAETGAQPPADALATMSSESELRPTPWALSAGTFEVRAALHEACSVKAAGATKIADCGTCLRTLHDVCSAALSGEEFRVKPFDWAPDVRLEPFGATEQGTALDVSDLDVRMSFLQFVVRNREEQLRYLKAVEAAPGDRFEVVQVIPASTPILRLRFEKRLDVDLTMGHEMEGGAEADRIVRDLLTAGRCKGVFHFVHLVKSFAKCHGLVNAYGGFMNSISWVFLAIVFMQRECCLPLHRDLAGTSHCDGASDNRLWPVDLTAGLFIRFFAFLEALGERPHLVLVEKAICRQLRKRTWSGGLAPPLRIELPGYTGSNLSLCLSWSGWRLTVSRCAQARRMLEQMDQSSFLDVVKQLFQTGCCDGRRLEPQTCCESGEPTSEGKRRRVTADGANSEADGLCV